jgi:CAAX protease family protein
VVVYIVILIIIQKFSGVPYTDVAKSSENMLHGILIPVGIASLILTIIALWSGWWKDVWRDKYKIKDHVWMHIFLILVVLGIIGNFFNGNISPNTSFIVYALIATAIVGYSEELLTRGLLVRGARGSGFTEVKVFLIVMLVFGFLHGLNIINGQSLLRTIQQIIFASLTGGVYYAIFRKSGLLAVPMILHALWDFSIFTHGSTNIISMKPIQIFVAGTVWLSYVLLLFAIRNFNVRKTKKEEIKESYI